MDLNRYLLTIQYFDLPPLGLGTEAADNNIDPKQPEDNFEHAVATVKEELDEATLLATKGRILSLSSLTQAGTNFFWTFKKG